MNRFCHICGVKNDNGSKFCSNCGEQINETSDSEKSLSQNRILSKDDTDCLCQGVIFTNINALGKKFNVNNDQVKELIDRYIYTLKQHGINYTLIDASYYRYSNPSVSYSRGLVHLSSDDNWLEYSKILTDYYMFGGSSSQPKPKYLFIIGGDDIIPSPIIEHYYYRDVWERMSQEQRDGKMPPDKDIETDIPYSYLLSDRTFDLLNSKEIFKYEPYFHIGRLPLATDSNIDTLLDYFQRVVAVMELGGIEIKEAYGQSDITWRVVSSLVAESLHTNNLFPDYEKADDSNCCNKIITTPNIFLDSVDQVFNCGANLFYFNMHGSDAPGNACFSGYLNHNGGSGFSPCQITRASRLNIFVTEACYGAKNKNYSTKDSMLLSAMSVNSMIYLGSSRIAWGASDEWIGRCVNDGADGDCVASSLGAADLICGEFMRAICDGLPAGDALYFARKKYIHKEASLSAIDAASIVEFNLFGDPILIANVANCDAKSANYSKGKIEPLADMSAKLGCKTVICYVVNDSSILNKVRGLIDKTMLEVRDTMNEYLYSNFNIEPRSLSYIIKNRYESGVEEYEFYYSVESDGHKIDYMATTDMKRNVITIYSTK